MNLVYFLLGIDVVSAETPTLAESIIADSGTVLSGLVTGMGTIITFITTNPLMILILGISFGALAGKWLTKLIVSLRLG